MPSWSCCPLSHQRKVLSSSWVCLEAPCQLVRIKRLVWGAWRPGRSGILTKNKKQKRRRKKLSVLWFLSLTQDFTKRTQTCFEYCRLWVWLCKSVVFLFVFKKMMHKRCRGMKLQEKQKYFFKQLYNAVFECRRSSGFKDLQFFILWARPSTRYHWGIFRNVSFSFNSHHNELPRCLNSILNLNSQIVSDLSWNSPVCFSSTQFQCGHPHV